MKRYDIIFTIVGDSEHIDKYLLLTTDENGNPIKGIRLDEQHNDEPDTVVINVNAHHCFVTRKEALQYIRNRTKNQMDAHMQLFQDYLKQLDEQITVTKD